MSWILGIGVGGVVVVAIWAWVSRERDVPPPDLGTISRQWRNEQRLKERESPDR